MKALAALAALALLGAGAPAAPGPGAREANEAFLLGLWPGFEPDGVGVLVAGGGAAALPGSELLARTLDRLGDARLAGAGGARAHADGRFPALGDVWLFEVGAAPCPALATFLHQPVVPQDVAVLGDRFWLYGGPESRAGAATSRVSVGGYGEAIEWLTGTFWTYETEVGYAGNIDPFCISAFGTTVNFPFLDGVAHGRGRGPRRGRTRSRSREASGATRAPRAASG